MTKTLKQEDITPELIIETAERLGISLTPHLYYDSINHCGCPAAVLAITISSALKDKEDGWLLVNKILIANGFSEKFLFGLIAGFDGYDNLHSAGDGLAGYAIGRSTRIKVDPVFAKEVA